jgi:hypothetical protein
MTSSTHPTVPTDFSIQVAKNEGMPTRPNSRASPQPAAPTRRLTGTLTLARSCNCHGGADRLSHRIKVVTSGGAQVMCRPMRKSAMRLTAGPRANAAKGHFVRTPGLGGWRSEGPLYMPFPTPLFVAVQGKRHVPWTRRPAVVLRGGGSAPRKGPPGLPAG